MPPTVTTNKPNKCKAQKSPARKCRYILPKTDPSNLNGASGQDSGMPPFAFVDIDDVASIIEVHTSAPDPKRIRVVAENHEEDVEQSPASSHNNNEKDGLFFTTESRSDSQAVSEDGNIQMHLAGKFLIF